MKEITERQLKSARKFLIKYFEVSNEYLEEFDEGNFDACDVEIANSLYDDISQCNIEEILEIMILYARGKELKG